MNDKSTILLFDYPRSDLYRALLAYSLFPQRNSYIIVKNDVQSALDVFPQIQVHCAITARLKDANGKSAWEIIERADAMAIPRIFIYDDAIATINHLGINHIDGLSQKKGAISGHFTHLASPFNPPHALLTAVHAALANRPSFDALMGAPMGNNPN